MTLNIIFLISGLVITALIGTKIIEGRRKSKPLFLRMVSLGDERVRVASHKFAHKYSETKEKLNFFFVKQLPLHTKNSINKISTLIKEKTEKHIGNIRGSKFLKKSDGISEYFKSISEKENGGRIDHDIENTKSTEDET